MTRSELRRRYTELRLRTNRMLKAYLENALDSKAIDPRQHETDYRLPKQILCASLEELRFQWGPNSSSLQKQQEKEIRDIQRRTITNWTQVR